MVIMGVEKYCTRTGQEEWKNLAARRIPSACKNRLFPMLYGQSGLIVDDSAYIRHVLCEAFKKKSDLKVCGEAGNGKEAIEKAQELRPDLIVLDLSMPVMNGLDAARMLKQRMPAVPLVMFSEYSNVFSEQEARTAGISVLVSKSEHVSVVVEKARSLLYDIAA
jgi:two-component system, chemotaxis family, chemotaxis protein CheY